MGYGSFSESTYHDAASTRRATGRDDFDYNTTATKIHDTLNPIRIKDKPFQMLESRDNEGRISTPVILTFDVTGSNIDNARVAQKKLPELMGKLTAVCDNPQVAVWANDDTHSVGGNAIQLSEFESNNAIDEAIRNIWLTGQGGGNSGESYDLLVYAAARKTITDSMQIRNKRGYMFLYADEPFFDKVSAHDIRNIFGDKSQADIPIGDIIAEAQQKWNIFVIWPTSGYTSAREQYEELFGKDHVETLQAPEMLCDKIASIISVQEQSAKENLAMSMADGEFTTRVV